MAYETRWTRPLNPLTDDLLLWLWRYRLHCMTPHAGKE